MRLITCLFFVGVAHITWAQNTGNSGFDFSSFNSAMSNGGTNNQGAGSMAATNIPPAGTALNAGGMGNVGQAGGFPQANNLPQNTPTGFPMANPNQPNSMNTLSSQTMNSGQMMNAGQMVNGGQLMNNPQTMGGQFMNNGQTMNSAQLMNGGQMANNAQMMNNGQLMSNGQMMNNQMMNNQIMNGQTGSFSNMNGQNGAFSNMNGQMMPNGQRRPMVNGQNMNQNGMFQDPTRMGALSQSNFNSLAFNPNTQSDLFQNQLNANNMPRFGPGQSMQGQQNRFPGSPFMQSPFMGPQMVSGPFGQQTFGAFPATPFSRTPGFGPFQSPWLNAFAPPPPVLGQPQFMPPPMFDANGNAVSTGQGTQQTTTMTTNQGQGQGTAFNSFLFPPTSQTTAGSTSFNLPPGMTSMMNFGNTGMVATTTTQFFDGTSGMPIGTPASVITTPTGQLVDGSNGLPVIANTMPTNPAGMFGSTIGGATGFQGTGVGQFPAINNQNAMFTNTGMVATAVAESPLPFVLPANVPGPFIGLASMGPVAK